MTSKPETVPDLVSKLTLGQLARIFLWLGMTSFGGPAAHIALMQEEIVRRRRWVTPEDFADLLGAVNLIPGPNSTEMAIHIGHRLSGWKGLIVAGVCFILPAFIMVLALASLYVTCGHLPMTQGILYGIKPVVIAVVLQALYKLAPTCLKNHTTLIVALICLIMAACKVNELIILLGSGLALLLGVGIRKGQHCNNIHLLAWPVPIAAVVISPGSWPLFWVFLKIGSVLFGSGYVLLAFLRADLVERLGWLSEQQLLDGVAIGQVTPGPVFTTATFIGYLLGGTPGAIVATLGIFLPAFVFVALSVPLLPRLRKSARAGAFLDGVNAASLALMAMVTWQLAQVAIVDTTTAWIGLGSLCLLWRGINSTWLVAGAALVGWFHGFPDAP